MTSRKIQKTDEAPARRRRRRRRGRDLSREKSRRARKSLATWARAALRAAKAAGTAP
jgi:hypothetical protein